MNSEKYLAISRRYAGWVVHAFTASGACVGVIALLAVYEHNDLMAMWLMCAAVFIDAVDGTFARLVNVKEVVPEIDGALLDNIVDFVNYTIVPAFFLLVTHMLPLRGRIFCVVAIIFSASYQFTQVDAKTRDHFFKGFPSYWNIAVFYLYFWQLNAYVNMSILLFLAFLSYVPIKYVYPSRLDYLTASKFLRICMLLFTALWGLATAGLLWIYPATNAILVTLSVGYLVFYFGMSLYRTFVPLELVVE